MDDSLDPARRAAAWTHSQQEVRRLVRDVDLDVRVPATPQWTAKDLLAHMVGVGVDTLAGRAPQDHGPRWTARTVAERRDHSLDDVLAEWDRARAQIVEAIATDVAPGLLLDLAVHEQDLRGALDAPGNRDGDAAAAAFAFFVGQFVESAADAPALAVRAGEHSFRVGRGDTVGTLVVDPYELLRAATGRRSEAQVRAWAWPDAPDAWIKHLSAFGELHESDLVE